MNYLTRGQMRRQYRKRKWSWHTSGSDAAKTSVLLYTVADCGELKKRDRLKRIIMDRGRQIGFTAEQL